MKRITPLLLAAMVFGSFATTTGCVVRQRDHHHHYNSGRRGPPPPPPRRDRDHRDKDRCRWERC